MIGERAHREFIKDPQTTSHDDFIKELERQVTIRFHTARMLKKLEEWINRHEK